MPLVHADAVKVFPQNSMLSYIRNYFIYLYAIDLVAHCSTTAEYCTVISYFTDNRFSNIRNRLFRNHKDKVAKFLSSYDHYHNTIYDGRVPSVFVRSGGYFGLNVKPHFIACKNFIEAQPSCYKTIENGVVKEAYNAKKPQIVRDFTVVCSEQIKAKCRLFNTLSRMHLRANMDELSNLLGRTEETERYLKF